MEVQQLKITWLGPCPTCERTEHKVKTIKGTKDHLYEDDEVKCWCGQTGLIETDGMEGAWCEWHAKEITEHDKFNAYYRKKYPEYWALLPSCNYQACTHHGELFNSWLNAKAQAVPEGFVLKLESWISVEIGTPAKFGTRVKIKRKSWDEKDNLVFIESEATYDKDSDFCELSNRSYEYETWFDHSLNKYLEEDELTHWMPLTKEAQEQRHE